MKLIYVAGPYRSIVGEWGVAENIRRAEQVAMKLWQAGWAVFCPHKNTAYFGGGCDDSTWLAGDLEILKRCDAIFLLHGWEESKGTIEEVNMATILKMPIFFESQYFEDYPKPIILKEKINPRW